jgi:hypothetical protein
VGVSEEVLTEVSTQIFSTSSNPKTTIHPYYIWYIFRGIEPVSTHFGGKIAPQGQQMGNFGSNSVSMTQSETFDDFLSIFPR